MGITWRFTMVLLSTLAALVIIVHSAEEEYEAQYRREIKPRSMDTETRRYGEQPWRTIKDEPLMMPTIDSLMEDVSSEETPRRRRLGRKRKRRPDAFVQDEEVRAHDRYFSEEPVRPRINSDDVEQEEMPKRRRKKQENRHKWSDSFEEDRPVRRRGLRRKRPKDAPRLSEFSDVVSRLTFDRNQKLNRDDEVEGNINLEPQSFKANTETIKYNNNNKEVNGDSNERDSSDSENKKTNMKSKIVTDSSGEDYSRDLGAALYHDKMIKKIDEKSNEYKEMIRKAKENGPIDPISLKDILKKSNGTSLSEILQQHNLSLTDLLHGKELALSILKSEEPFANEEQITEKTVEGPKIESIKTPYQESSEERLSLNSEIKYIEPVAENITTESVPLNQEYTTTELVDTTTENIKFDEEKSKNIRRFKPSIRRKQYIRPVVNENYSNPQNRDLITLNARNFYSRRRNITKAQQWRDMIPVMNRNQNASETTEKIAIEIPNLNDILSETTKKNESREEKVPESAPESNDESVEPKDVIDEVDEKVNKEPNEDASKHLVFYQNPVSIQTTNTTGLRKQVLNNMVKKKRRKQNRTSTTETPNDEIGRDIFDVSNIVAASDIVAKTQEPNKNHQDDTILEDFMSNTNLRKNESYKPNQRMSSTAPQIPIDFAPSVDTAKIEIEEILNDTRASAKLSKILMERNMTLSQLVEHRERGSSYVHLADIFHNTSREPNPPEPFLSKSLIEPISKETYPLRALLDANIHDTTTKATTVDPNSSTEYINIPYKMDFGSNVNENAENMGIMSLFNNIKNNVSKSVESKVMKDSQGTPYKSSITVVNATEDIKSGDLRQGRVMNEVNDNQDDVVTWNEIFSFMRRSYENQTNELKDVSGLVPAESIRKPPIETIENNLEDLIVLEEVQDINEPKVHETEKKTTHNNNTAATDHNNIIPLKTSGILSKIPSPTRSVTLATACIVGLAMVLFLLSYVGYIYFNQKTVSCKKNLSEEKIPTPVFENRKGHKNNNSTRSISPMLNSNIYTLSTLDSQNGKESPDYMWDSLRKPFQ